MKDAGLIDWLFSGPGQMATAGAAGGLVRWITLRDNWREGIPTVVVGAISAVYLGPLVVPILEPAIGKLTPNGNADGFSAFIVGLAGIALTGAVIDFFKARRASGLQNGGKDDA